MRRCSNGLDGIAAAERRATRSMAGSSVASTKIEVSGSAQPGCKYVTRGKCEKKIPPLRYSACAAASSSARTKPSTYASASASGQIGVAYCTVRQSCPCTVTAETEMHGADTV